MVGAPSVLYIDLDGNQRLHTVDNHCRRDPQWSGFSGGGSADTIKLSVVVSHRYDRVEDILKQAVEPWESSRAANSKQPRKEFELRTAHDHRLITFLYCKVPARCTGTNSCAHSCPESHR